MRALPRLVSCAAGVALFLTFAVLALGWLGSDQSLASAGNVLYRELQRGEALSGRDELVRRTLEGKTQITAELVAGRLTLPEAAAAFREWNETLDDGKGAWVAPYVTPADQEAVCRNVIVWAAQSTESDPERQAAVVGRLEEELRQFLHPGAPGGP
jgi:hypothetical protein